jgi:hypothetical protein
MALSFSSVDTAADDNDVVSNDKFVIVALFLPALLDGSDVMIYDDEVWKELSVVTLLPLSDGGCLVGMGKELFSADAVVVSLLFSLYSPSPLSLCKMCSKSSL